jgi:putative DNA primase/helicase
LADIPKGDIEEILEKITPSELIEKIEINISKFNCTDAKTNSENNSHPSDSRPRDEGETIGRSQHEIKKEFNQEAFDLLFGDNDKPWICADDTLYQWSGTHYEKRPDSEQRPRIADFCNRYSVVKRGVTTFPFAKTSSVKEVLQWAKMKLEVNPALLNPPGLNCTNGVLELHGNHPQPPVKELTPTPTWKLTPHDPAKYYIYKPVVEYNPNAPTEGCDRLLEVLSPAQREIFLSTISASLDLSTIRKYKGRLVRALLLKGHGSNGKDTLREVVKLMYGRYCMTSCSLSDFAMMKVANFPWHV